MPNQFYKVLAAAAIACSSGFGAYAQDADWSAVVENAKKEGSVTFYQGLNPSCTEGLASAFRSANPGIDIDQVRLGSEQAISRIRTEYSTGRNLVDVALVFEDPALTEGMKQGWMLKWTPPELSNFPADANRDDSMFAVLTVREVLIYNKNIVSEADTPTEWSDLFDPKWKGRVGINPPWRAVTVQQLIALWEKQGITDAAEKLKANGVRFFEGSAGVTQAVVRGDVAVAEVTDHPVNALIEDGAPVGFVYPKSGTSVSENMLFVAERAPHPNAAKVLANWLMSEDGQKSLLACGQSSNRNNAPALSHLPATASLENTVRGATLITPEWQEKLVENWRTVFGVR